MGKEPIDVLEHYWGFSAFKSSQKIIIDSVLDQRDVLALLPTGGGKSLCFQLPSMVQEGICIVVSPLIALIQNQVEALKDKGIKAIGLTGGIPFDELNNLLDNCLYGNYKFLYLSPERLKQDIVRERIQQMNVNLIAIDEAHCISQWGHDFRPAYLECSKLRDLVPNAPVIALTATATEKVANDIIDNLGLVNPYRAKDSFSRDNIAFSVVHKEDKRYQLKQQLTNIKGSAIVYVRTRRLTQDLSNFLNAHQCSATFFHGGLSKKEKQERLNLWINNKVSTIVATNAFGMGIDKPDVDLVLHYQIPDCIENYFQEAGRAGRNGENARAVMLTNKTDEVQVKNQFLSVLPDIPFIKLVYLKLNNYFQIAYGEGNDQVFTLNFNQFCDIYQLNPLMTYNVFKILDQNSVVALSESFSRKTTLRFLSNKEHLFNYLSTHSNLMPAVQVILRTYGGVFEHDIKVNTHLISKKAGMTEDKVLWLLRRLKEDEIISYQEQHNDLEMTFLVPREDDITINPFAKKVKDLNLVKTENIEHMLAYINNSNQCRNQQLLSYFGEKGAECGICDNCISNMPVLNKTMDTIDNEIRLLLKKKERTSRQLIEVLPHREADILKVLKLMLDMGTISINTKNEYELG